MLKLTRRDALATLGATPLLWSTLADAATPKDTLVIAMTIDDAVSLDPGEAYEFSSIEACTNIYDRLLRNDLADLSRFLPSAATGWTISSDARTYTFKMRPGMKFHSGNPVTAADAAWSMQRIVILDKPPAFLLSQFGWNKDNVKELVRAIDATTLVFTLKEDFAPSLVLNIMTSIAASVVDSKLAMSHEDKGDYGNGWLKTNSASSGAYKLVSWKANEAITLEAHSGFHGGASHVKRVTMRHIPEAGTQRLQIEKGDVDIARSLTPDQLKPLAGNKSVRIDSAPGATSVYGIMNLAYEPLANVKVRRAIKMLVDYQGLANTVLKGRYFVQQTFLPLGIFGAVAYNPFKLDVEGAKKLLAEAGYANGFELKLSAINIAPYVEIAQSMQQTLGLAGIKVTINSGDSKAIITEIRARKGQLTLISWAPDYVDPHSNADWFAHNDNDSDTPVVKTGSWRAHWLIPELTKQMVAASKEVDTKKRQQMYVDLQKTVTDEGPFLFLFQDTQIQTFRSNVKGFTIALYYDLFAYRTVTKA